MEGEKILEKSFRERDIYFLAKYFFNIDLTHTQETIVRTIAFGEHNRVILSCMTRYGKSYCVALGALFYLLFHNNKRVLLVAPTYNQTSILRNYMAEFMTRCTLFTEYLEIDMKGERLSSIKKEVSKQRMTFRDGSELRVLTAGGNGEGLMGFGGDLIVVDEDCLIDYEVYRLRISRMLGDNPDSILVSIGNPFHRDNQMFEHWNDPKYKKIHIDWKIAVKEGRVTQEFIDEQREALTPMEFQILYDAQFPEETEDQLIAWKWITHAIREQPKGSYGDKRLGLDVARFGIDLTVYTIGYKYENLYVITHIESHSKEDTMTTVGRVRGLIDKYNIKRICVDTDGLGGGVSDRLQELKDTKEIEAKIIQFHSGVGIHTGEADKKRFSNQKAQAFFHLREQFEKGNIIIPDNAILKSQLSKMKWKVGSSGKIQILDPGMAVDDTSEKKSPDFADSLCYFTWDLERKLITVW